MNDKNLIKENILYREALEHVRTSAQTGTYPSGVVISFDAFAHVRDALDVSENLSALPDEHTETCSIWCAHVAMDCNCGFWEKEDLLSKAMQPNNDSITNTEILNAVNYHNSEIKKLTEIMANWSSEIKAQYPHKDVKTPYPHKDWNINAIRPINEE